MTTFSEAIVIGEPRVGAKGNRSAQLTQKDGQPITVTATAPLTCPFGAGVYQGDGTETRLNIDYGDLGGLLDLFRTLDEVIVKEAIKASAQLWPGRNLTPEQVREGYHSAVKEREGYNPTVRAKVDTAKVRCWAWDGSRIPLPDNRAKGCLVQPKLVAKNIWFMAPNKWGVTWDTADLRIQEPSVECPWA